MKKYLLYLFLFFVSAGSLRSQYYTTGQDPASIKWYQIKADSFRIIFPEGFVRGSQDLARILGITMKYETNSLPARVPRMPFLIHARSAESNGLTVWSPRRIELFPCPPQDIYAEEWLEQLVLHEYRHAVQTSKMNQGFSKVLYYVFGEQATGAVLGLYIPRWFLEGDATVTETALSGSGRGRVASFSAPLRAQLLQKGIYSYDMATMGSYKVFTPDSYILGYHMVAKGREHFGTELWDHTLDKVAKLPFMVVPFNAGIKKQTGLWKRVWYRSVMEELLIGWQREEDGTRQSLFQPVTTPDADNYTTWDRAQFLSDSTMVVARWSNEDVARLLLINRNGKSRKLVRLGPYQPGSLSVAGDVVVWAEYRPDIRWENRSYSILRMWTSGQADKRTSGQADKRTSGQADKWASGQVGKWTSGQVGKRTSGQVMDLSRKSRYFSPALSPDGSRIAAVRITEENRSFIDILDTGTGDLVDSIPAPDNGLFLQPAWSADGRKIAFLLLTRAGKSLQILDIQHGSVTSLVAPSFREISGPPLFYKNWLLFMADYTGIENIFAIDTLSRQLYQVTSARFQATNPSVSPDSSTLVYSDYNSDGMMVVARTSDPARWIKLDSIPVYTFELAEAMARQEKVNIQDSKGIKYEERSTKYESKYEVGNTKSDSSLTTSPHHHSTTAPPHHGTTAPLHHGTTAPRHHDTTAPHHHITSHQLPVTRYRKISHLFNLHSWAPVSIDAGNLSLKPGVSVLSQNLLSTMFAGAGYEYDLSERTGKFYLNLSYKGWFPVIDVNYSYGKRAGIGRYSNTGETFRYTWNESNLQARISVPLNLSRGIWYRRIQPSIGTSWIYVIHDNTTPAPFTKGTVNTLDYRLYMYNYIRSNYQDMFPKWGQILDINFRHTPFTGNDMGSVFGISTNLYFPGIIRHHGIRLYGGYQRRWDNLVYGYQFSNLIALPRGTEAIYPEDLVSLSVNYKFPFLRLDASLGSVLYIKRFTLNLFYDRAHGWEKNEDIFSESTGFELTSELHILRFIAPFQLGIRGAWLPGEDRWAWRFLWGVSF